ncbi:MAG TPA: ABC transporter ATP-binding protein [Planctomycetota bacterium]|nr:ABC transporter ATP-binding protein [Planctomycetota bacterium]
MQDGSTTAENAIELRGLRKSYGERSVLDGIDLVLARGSILGYIGPNGAGKSTTVKILCGLMPDFEGEVRVLGLDPRADPLAVKRKIGYVPENAVLYELLTVAEFLLLVGRLHGMADALVQRRASEFLRVFELEERLGARIQTLSKGMRQKVLLTSALLHDPELVVLDEPLSGLDVNATILVKELIRALAAAGKTVFYCSHVMDVVERVCDRIAILDGGKLVAQGSFEELQAARGGGSLEQIFSRLTSVGGQAEAAQRLIATLRSGDGA